MKPDESNQRQYSRNKSIPQPLWIESTLFDSKLNKMESDFLTSPLSEVNLNQFETFSWEPRDQLKVWLCVLVGHRGSTTSQLLDVAANLHLSKEVIFTGAALTNRGDILDQIKLNSDEINHVVQANNCVLFRTASALGFLDVLKRLIELAPNEKQAMIGACDYHAFTAAAEYGHIHILDWLKQIAPLELTNMMMADQYDAFYRAALNGHLNVLRWLKYCDPSLLQNMLESHEFVPFQMAALYGHVDVLIWMRNQVLGETWERMIKANFYWAFDNAALNGHLDVLLWLGTQDPQELNNMISAHEYAAFRHAAHSGHKSVLEWLKFQMPESWPLMIKTYDFEGFRKAVTAGHTEVALFLLQDPDCFAFADSRMEYNDLTSSFVANALEALRLDVLNKQITNPAGIYEPLDANESRLYYFILRNLIRRNDPSQLENMQFLLQILRVKSQVLFNLQTPQTYELFDLANLVGNRDFLKLFSVAQYAPESNHNERKRPIEDNPQAPRFGTSPQEFFSIPEKRRAIDAHSNDEGYQIY